MNKFKRPKIYLIIILLFIFISFKVRKIFIDSYNDELLKFPHYFQSNSENGK